MSLKLRKPLRKFADFMEFKLRQNDHKGGWNDYHNFQLCDRLMEEVRELKRAIAANEPAMLIAHEAADVANFAMMIADNAGALKSGYPLTLGDVPKPPKEIK